MTKLQKQASNIIEILRKQNPNPATELNFESPWQLLVAAVLSAQSTDKQVNKVTKRLFLDYPEPQDIAALTPEQLAENIKSIGLFRNKSKNLVGAANEIMAKYGGEVPRSRKELQSLPGVGRKTANVVLSNAFGIPALAVDTHVFRVAKRTGLAKAKTPEETEKQLMRHIPKSQWSDAHHWFILHGRYICTARKPKCEICPIYDYCRYSEKRVNAGEKK